MDIKKGDLVYIRSGELRRYDDVVDDDKGKDKDKESSLPTKNKRVGKVLFVDRKKNTALVEGFNIVKRHTKPNQKNQQGGIVTKEAPIHRSRLALYSTELGEPTKVGVKIETDENGRRRRIRVCKKTGNEI